MSYLNAWQSYRQVTAQTASPGQLVAMLYDGAISFLERALHGFTFDDPLELNSTVSNNVLRAQAIIAELNSSLDLTRGGELASTLRGLYTYMDRRLNESNLNKRPDGIVEAKERLEVLRDAWREMLASRGPVRGSSHLSTCV